MSEGSIPPFGSILPRSFPEVLRRRLGRLAGRLSAPLKRRRPSPELRSRAASAIREYAEANAAVFDRAARLLEKVERLEREGTPSESVRNRAERAKSEIEAGLGALRASFSAFGREGLRAFDSELESLHPTFKVSGDPT